MKRHASQLSALLHTVADGVIQIDKHGVITLFNSACETLFGYQADEVLGHNVKLLMPSPFHDEHDRYLSNYVGTGIARIIGIGREVIGRRKDGTTFPMHLSVGHAELEGETAFLGIVVDLSDRKKAEEALREGAAKFRAIIDTAVDGVILIDSVGSILEFNPACETLFGYRAQDVVGRNVKLLMPQSYAHEHDTYIHNYLGTGVRKIIGIGREVVGKRRDGTTFPMELSVGETHQHGSPLFVGIIHDISERKRAEEQREILISQLERSNEERGHFAYAASHDLQQHLRMITAFSDLLSTNAQASIDEAGREYLTLIRESSRRMQALLDDLLVLGRIGSEPDRSIEFDAGDLTEEVISTMIESLAEPRPRFDVGSLPVLHGNAVRFSRLIQNLIGNAIKYVTPSTTPEIRIWAEDEGSHWRLFVQDNGIGIDEAYHERIFEPFRRLHGEAAYSGTGLGLAICRKIVDGFGGTLSVRSMPGAGSTFHFTIAKQAWGKA